MEHPKGATSVSGGARHQLPVAQTPRKTKERVLYRLDTSAAMLIRTWRRARSF